MAENRFNLVDEKWLPLANGEKASLAMVFSKGCPKLGGTPREKIAIFKLLLAIAQAASTPEDEDEWACLMPDALAQNCQKYLDKWHDAFYLYGKRPFLQMPVAKAELQPYGAVMPEVAAGNNPRFMHLQTGRQLKDADKALLLVCETSMCLGGKKVDNSFSLKPGYEKGKGAKPGPGMGFSGFLHCFLTGRDLLETIWLNLQTEDQIEEETRFGEGLGIPPWEKMPQTEDCEVAQALKESFMGRLVPMARFCLLQKDGLHSTEGLIHGDYKAGIWDPSVAIARIKKNNSKNKEEVIHRPLWADPEKMPWRYLTAMLAFLDSQNQLISFNSQYLHNGINHLVKLNNENKPESFGLWCGGMRVSFNAGEQFATGNDDIVESEFHLKTANFKTDKWYETFAKEMSGLEILAKTLYGCVASYSTAERLQPANVAPKAVGMFWEEAEKLLPDLLSGCQEDADGSNNPEKRKKIRTLARKLAYDAYDAVCPHGTGRQISHWAQYRFPPIKNKETEENP